MAKGKPRTATAASVILQQAATPEPTHREVAIRYVDQDEQEQESTIPVATTYGKPAYKPATRGNNAGLRQGETRITCIFRKDQSDVLHAWSKTTGRTFREVCLAMADRYIEEVIRPATSGDRKLKRGTAEPPEAYADLYDETPDMWAQFFE